MQGISLFVSYRLSRLPLLGRESQGDVCLEIELVHPAISCLNRRKGCSDECRSHGRHCCRIPLTALSKYSPSAVPPEGLAPPCLAAPDAGLSPSLPSRLLPTARCGAGGSSPSCPSTRPSSSGSSPAPRCVPASPSCSASSWLCCSSPRPRTPCLSTAPGAASEPPAPAAPSLFTRETHPSSFLGFLRAFLHGLNPKEGTSARSWALSAQLGGARR